MRGADDRAVSMWVVVLGARGTTIIGLRPKRKGLRALEGGVALSMTVLSLVVVLSVIPAE
jgi:hypothetical protein